MTFDEQPVKFEEEIELLGVPIRRDLSIAPFMERTAKKCMKRLGMLKKLKITSFEIRKSLANTMILSTLDYCNGLTHNTTKKAFKEYDKIINATVRYICNMKKRNPTSEKRKELGILDAEERATFKVLYIIWKTMAKGEPKMIKKILPQPNTRAGNRSEGDKRRVGDSGNKITNISKRAIVNYSKEYNNVRKEARQTDDPKLFKKLLKEQIANSNETSQSQ